jgi:hypothetical protein
MSEPSHWNLSLVIRYLKVSTFEEIFATVAGRYGRYGLWAGRAAVITATTGMLVSWLGCESLHP